MRMLLSAFGKLKGQWRILKSGLQSRTHKDWDNTIITCCVLHNLTILLGGQGWKFEDKFRTGRPPVDSGSGSLPTDPDDFVSEKGSIPDSKTAAVKRDKIVTHLKENGYFDK